MVATPVVSGGGGGGGRADDDVTTSGGLRGCLAEGSDGVEVDEEPMSKEDEDCIRSKIKALCSGFKFRPGDDPYLAL